MTEKPYRKNVGIIVFNRHGEVLVGERLNVLGSWQFPQGGIDKGEEPLAAAKRELYEEVGISDAKLVKEHDDWLHYDFPDYLQLGGMGKYRGQTQKWFLFFWDCAADQCNLEIHDREFERVKFIPFEQCVDTIVDFKKQVYEELVRSLQPVVQDYVEGLKA